MLDQAVGVLEVPPMVAKHVDAAHVGAHLYASELLGGFLLLDLLVVADLLCVIWESITFMVYVSIIDLAIFFWLGSARFFWSERLLDRDI